MMSSQPKAKAVDKAVEETSWQTTIKVNTINTPIKLSVLKARSKTEK